MGIGLPLGFFAILFSWLDGRPNSAYPLVNDADWALGRE
jgi:hypothetical protein